MHKSTCKRRNRIEPELRPSISLFKNSPRTDSPVKQTSISPFKNVQSEGSEFQIHTFSVSCNFNRNNSILEEEKPNKPGVADEKGVLGRKNVEQEIHFRELVMRKSDVMLETSRKRQSNDRIVDLEVSRNNISDLKPRIKASYFQPSTEVNPLEPSCERVRKSISKRPIVSDLKTP